MTLIVCTGRPVYRDGTPAGERCGAIAPYGPEYVEELRVLGWRLSPERDDVARPAMCPTCAAPGAAVERPDLVQADPLPGL